MRTVATVSIFTFVVASGYCLEPPNAELRDELKRMVKEDQAARAKLLEAMAKQPPANAAAKRADTPELKQLADIDAKNTARMKQIVDKYGWPGESLVGTEGARNAWLLVQHADADRPFQKRCLQFMETALKKNDASKTDYAYLTDRVLCADGQKQRYGTQFENKDGKWQPKPMEDPANVDTRRKEMGMPPLAEYAKMIEQMYERKPQEKK
jgi:hypothetical protein